MNNATQKPDIIVGTIEKNKTSRIQVALREYHGQPLVDTRIHFDPGEGEWRPSTKGVCIRLTQLPELIRLLQLAQRTAAEHGLLERG
jgi:hypothetical protein